MFEQLQDALNKYQELEQENERLRVKLLEYSVKFDEQNDVLAQAIEDAQIAAKTQAAASKAMALANINQKLIYDLEKERIKTKELNDQVQGFKRDNPKKMKEQVNRLKTKNAELVKGNEMLKKHNKQYRSEVSELKKDLDQIKISRAQLGLTHAMTVDDHQLWLVPNRIRVQRGYGSEFIFVLMHVAPNGVGYMVTTNNGKISLDHMVHEKDLPPMPEKMYNHAEEWLAKVEAQGYAVTDADLLAVGGFEEDS